MQCGAGAGVPEKWGRLTDRQTVGGEGHARGLTEIAQKKKKEEKHYTKPQGNAQSINLITMQSARYPCCRKLILKGKVIMHIVRTFCFLFYSPEI